MILPRVILLHLALVVAPLSTYAFAAVDVPDPGRNVPRLPERSRFQATVTAYSSSPDETWGDPFITASGRRVFDGLVACPRALPFGTQVSIGDRTYQCYDRLHRKYDHRFDIWMATKAAALTFGKQQLPVEVIEVGVAAPHQRLHTVLQDWGVVARILTGPHDAHRQDPHLPMRYDTGRPRAIIRLRISQPRTASLPCPAGLRARRPSPMMDLYRKNVFSTRP